MISPYRLRNTNSSDSPENIQKHGNSGNTSVQIATAIHNNAHHTTPSANNSFYRSPSRDIRMKPVEALDISKIDHEAIRNDVELKKLSRNPAAFNTHSFEEDMYEEDESSDDDLYADEERLVDNPLEERRMRTLVSQASTLSNQNVPRTPKTLSFASSYSSSDRNSKQHLDDPISIVSSRDTEPQLQDNNLPQNWKEQITNVMLKMLRACVFQFFMIYWIVKEPIIRTITFFTMIVSFILVDPIIFISAKLSSRNHHWVPSSERRKQIASAFTLILFISFFTPSLRSYVSDTTVTTIDYLQTTIKSVLSQRTQSNFDMALYRRLRDDNSKLWSTIKRMETEITGMKNTDEDILSQLNTHYSNYENQQTQLNNQQSQLTSLKESVAINIKNAIREQLPELVFINTNENDQLELSPQFYNYFKDASFWNDFLKQNDAAIKKYFSEEMTEFLNQQKKQGAVIGKDTFMKLLSDSLMKNHGNIKEVSFNNLVDIALKKYHQDVLNTPDFALSSRGAQVLYSSTSSTYYRYPGWVQGLQNFVGMSIVAKTPDMALKASTHPGECWQMFGDKGQLGIILSQSILITGFSVEYPSKEMMSNEMQAAPKEIELFGLPRYPDNTNERVSLARVTYDIDSDSTIQTFDLKEVPTEPFSAVVLQFKSNYGCPEHTDIYRVRVHGIPV